MPLFVATTGGRPLDGELRAEIIAAVRSELSPRHVPDEIIAMPGIPHTKTGKKLEVPVKRLYQGVEVSEALDLGSVDDSEVMLAYVRQAEEWRAGPDHPGDA
jgi:acetoacetyl-CoA synthetase